MYRDRKPPKLLIEHSLLQTKADLLSHRPPTERPIERKVPLTSKNLDKIIEKPTFRSQSPPAYSDKKPRNSAVALNHILAFLKREDVFIDSKTFKSIINLFSLNKTAFKLKGQSAVKPTLLQKGQVAPKDPHALPKKKYHMRPLAGKMYANELWSKKQYMQMAHISPVAAKKDAMRKLGIDSEIQHTEKGEKTLKSLKSQRSFRKQIAHEIFNKYQNGVLSDEDVQVESSLYEQILTRMKLDSPCEINQPKSNQCSTRMISPTLKERNSPRFVIESRQTLSSNERDQANTLRNSPNFYLPNIKSESLLLKYKGKNIERQQMEPKSPESSKLKNLSQEACGRIKEEIEENSIDVLTCKTENMTPSSTNEPRSSLLKNGKKHDFKRPKLSKLILTARSSGRNLTVRDLDNTSCRVSSYSRIFGMINEAQNQFDSLIDECDKLAHDNSLQKIITKMTNEINRDACPEFLKKKREKLAVGKKQAFIEDYSFIMKKRKSERL